MITRTSPFDFTQGNLKWESSPTSLLSTSPSLPPLSVAIAAVAIAVPTVVARAVAIAVASVVARLQSTERDAMRRPLVAVVDPYALLTVRVPLLEKLSDEAGSMFFFMILNENVFEKIDPPPLSIGPRCCVLLYAWSP